MWKRLDVKYTLLVPHFNETWNFSQQVFLKSSNIKFHQKPSIGNRVAPCGQTDGQTDVTMLIVVFRNFANAPKNCIFCLPHFTYETVTTLKTIVFTVRYEMNWHVRIYADNAKAFWSWTTACRFLLRIHYCMRVQDGHAETEVSFGMSLYRLVSYFYWSLCVYCAVGNELTQKSLILN